ncbi:MAG: MG2 domain-containing protein, partial [Acidobacteriota bacterium]|nr:MG2 domain-containing protein [Acidobacteriota bacterium]
DVVIDVPEVEDVAFRFPLRVREWLDGESGAVVGSLRSRPETRKFPLWFFSQVTPYHVHVKLGHYNTTVWVTDLATGVPVEGADVEIVERLYASLAGMDDAVDNAVTDAHGLAVLAGTDQLDPAFKLVQYWKNREEPHLFVRVRNGTGQAIVPLAQDFFVYPSVFNVRREKHGHLRAWGATAQGVYRAGETVQYKIYVRNEGNERLVAAPTGAYDLTVKDPMDKVVYERRDIELNDFGAFDGEFKIPETGVVGWYSFELRTDFAGKQSWEPMRVLVSDFTPAPFRVTTDLDGELFRVGDEVVVSTAAALYAGGPYVEAETRVTGVLRPVTFRPAAPEAEGFWFDTGRAETETIHESHAELDNEGRLETGFVVRSEQIVYGALTVESAVRDDRGKYVAGRQTARYAGRDRFVGLRQDDWVLRAGEPAGVHGIVTDDGGSVVSGVPMRFTILYRETKASRVKGAGNAYLTEYIHEWKEVASCDEDSSEEKITCSFVPEHAGLYRIAVEIEDTAGRSTRSETERWAAGRGVVLWEEPPGHHLEIFPESETLRVGETARYLIKNPFPGAKALVTVERLEDSTAILDRELESDFVPGFYLSVVVMSPRVERP